MSRETVMSKSVCLSRDVYNVIKDEYIEPFLENWERVIIFDQNTLKERLARLASARRKIFALCCAERLIQLYVLYCAATGQGDRDQLRSALDQLWDASRKDLAECEQQFGSDFESFIPGEYAEWTPLNPLAENAVAALAYACRSAGDVQAAVWAAVQGCEAVDYVAHTLQGIEFVGPASEAEILSSECVQSELHAQDRDLAELHAIAEGEIALKDVANAFRRRAEGEGENLARIASRLSDRV